MSLFDLQDVFIAIGSIATLDLSMVVDLIEIYGLKGPYFDPSDLIGDRIYDEVSVMGMNRMFIRWTGARWAGSKSITKIKTKIDVTSATAPPRMAEPHHPRRAHERVRRLRAGRAWLAAAVDAGIDQLNFHSVQLGYLKFLQMGLDAGIDQLNFHSVQLGYLYFLQMGNADPNKTEAGNKYEVKPQYEELSNSKPNNEEYSPKERKRTAQPTAQLSSFAFSFQLNTTSKIGRK
ncbi:hypothetical protein F511_14621 [Dorcoceras hygrometricum]|uniref:Uncharacterized protein n=1 Tax=Dorcoceras hygrometricum TaxID=472368 RepID=A0A2Z6ZY44_9LAMI|nr:hypothetical protein F511_14621 [Dorcoceras hygrometricum]